MPQNRGETVMVRISEKHGLNPSISKCFYCGEDKGIILFGKTKGDQKAPHYGVFDREPCSSCQKFMEEGIILISVRDGERGKTEPHRSGKFVVIKREAFLPQIFPVELRESIKNKGCCFIEDSDWKQLGLPEPNTN